MNHDDHWSVPLRVASEREAIRQRMGRHAAYLRQMPVDDLDTEVDSVAMARIERNGHRWQQIAFSVGILALVLAIGVAAGIWMAVVEFQRGGGL